MKFCKGLFLKSMMVLGVFSLFACSNDTTTVADDGSTEETNASILWEYSGSQNAWHYLEDNNDEISAAIEKNGLKGTVSLSSTSEDGFASVGVSLDLVKDGEDSKDLSNDSGVCVTYSSDLTVELYFDFGEETNAALEYGLPSILLYPTGDTLETACERWDDMMQDDEKYPVGPEVLTDVRSVQIVFNGTKGSRVGNFLMVRVTRYKEPVYDQGSAETDVINTSVESLVAESFLWDEDSDDRVNTGSEDPTAGEWFETEGPEGWGYVSKGFNIVNDKLDGTNVSAWRGLCVSFYSEEDDFQIFFDVSDSDSISAEGNSWFVTVEGMATRHWVRIPWGSFEPENSEGESLESAVTHVSRIRFEKDEDLKLHIYKVGSYDQCSD